MYTRNGKKKQFQYQLYFDNLRIFHMKTNTSAIWYMPQIYNKVMTTILYLNPKK